MVRKLALVALLALTWLALAGVAWVMFLRRAPGSPLEWLLLVAIGPLAYLLVSALGQGVYEVYNRLPGVRHLQAFAEARTSGRKFSWLRVGVYLITILAFFGIIVVVVRALHLRLP